MKYAFFRRYPIGMSLAIIAVIASACGSPAAPATVPATQLPGPTSAPVATASTAATPSRGSTQPTSMVAATAAPATSPTAPAAASSGGKVTLAFFEEPDALIPAYTTMSFSVYTDEICCSGLWNWDDKENPEPELAAEVPSGENGGLSADGKTITVKLRDHLSWPDGSPISSEDISASIGIYTNPKNTVNSRYGFDKSGGGPYVTSVETPNPQTAVIHYSQAFGPWQATLGLSSNGGMGLYPAKALEAAYQTNNGTLDKSDFLLKPVGAGPFQITENVSGDHITLKANPNYWRGKPKLDEIDIKIVPSTEAGMAGVQTGDVDIVEDLAESNIPDIQAMEPKVHLVTKPGPQFEHLLFNLGSPPTSDTPGPAFFQDLQVRKAIILGIDRQTIVDKLLFGKTTVPADLWPNSPWENKSLKPYPYDTQQAIQILEADGWKKGGDGIYAKSINGQNTRLSFSYMTTSGNQLRADQQVLITQQLKKIGVEMTIQDVPSTTFFGSFAAGGPMALGKYQMAGFTTGFYPDPDPTDTFLCDGIPTAKNPSGGNYYHLCDQKLSDLSKQQATEANPTKRKSILDQMQQLQYDNVYFVPLYARLKVWAVSDRVKGMASSYSGHIYWDTWEWGVSQ